MKTESKIQFSSRRNTEYDILAVGELLIDMISQETHSTLGEASNFNRFQGGSPANFSANMARLGNSAALLASVGEDSLGDYLIKQVQELGMQTDYINRIAKSPTTLILIVRSEETPDFLAYRSADRFIEAKHIPDALLKKSRIYHSTCFALSLEPAQSSILDGAVRAREFGCQLSLDANYSPRIWENRIEAKNIIEKYCQLNAFVKISLDDIARLFNDDTLTPEKAISIFHGWGAVLVCLTLGKKGSIISWEFGKHQSTVPAPQVKVLDATGAGDAYWAGFLTAWLDGYQPLECAKAGHNFAELKLGVVGPLPHSVDKSRIYKNI